MLGPFNKTKTVWLLFILAIAVLSAGAWYWLNQDKKPIWVTSPIEQGNVQVSVTATGTLQALVTIQVGTQVSGTISELKADFNSHVKKGQIIARLDTTLLVATLTDAQSNYAKVKAQAQQASEELRRTQALFTRELVSQSELDISKTNSEVARANLNSSRSGIERARINLRFATITSPIDGIVLSRAVDVGQTVAASFNTPTLFTLAGDLREMQVQAAVDEADIGKVKVGQAATFSVDAYPDQIFSGEVRQIRLQPKVDQNVVTYDVVIQAPNPDLRLMPGMTANLTLAIARHENILTVPAAALKFRPPDDTSGARKKLKGPNTFKKSAEGTETRGKVFVLENEKPKLLRVTLGLSDGNRVEVSGEGIALGVEVLTGFEIPGAKSGTSKTSAFGSPMGPGRRP